MADPSSKTSNADVFAMLPAVFAERIDELIEIGVYGANRSEVAVYLLTRSLDDLMRAGVVSKGLMWRVRHGQ